MRALSELPRVSWPRLIGGALVATGLFGVLLSFAGMIAVGFAGARAERALLRELATLDTALVTTAEGLTIAGAALADAEATLGSLSTTLGDATEAISATQPTLTTLQNLTGTSLPQTISETRAALDAARATASVADNVLGALSFLGVRYNPEVPLSASIGGVSESLAAVPAELAEVTTGLAIAGTNLQQLTRDLAEVGTGIDTIAGSVERSTTVITQYQTTVADLQAEVAGVRRDAPGWIATVRWGLYLGLVWMALAQIGLLAQGWALLGRWGGEEVGR